jgi:pyrrolidone-carboxylate peptidase
MVEHLPSKSEFLSSNSGMYVCNVCMYDLGPEQMKYRKIVQEKHVLIHVLITEMVFSQYVSNFNLDLQEDCQVSAMLDHGILGLC